MSAYVTQGQRQQLLAADDHRCAYCQTSQFNSGSPMVIDHIVPQSKGGGSDFGNLCFSCRRCNEFKGSATAMEEPLTGETVSFFHPRRQQWSDHFIWDAAALRLVGITAVGRVTVIGLKMNNEVIVAVRRKWVSVGWHPPL